MSQQSKDKAFKKFVEDDGTVKTKKTVTSTDDVTTVVGSQRIARKNGQ